MEFGAFLGDEQRCQVSFFVSVHLLLSFFLFFFCGMSDYFYRAALVRV